MDGKELKALRLQMNLSQKDMAPKLFISVSAYTKLELGLRRMSKPVAEIARQLKSHADQNEFLDSQGLQ